MKQSGSKALSILGGKRILKTTPAFETYWRFAAERQSIFFRRLRGDRIVTDDPVLAAHRFTNAYRASDRVSQYLISNVIPASNDARDMVLRVLLFKIFNRIETWRYLEAVLGEIHHDEFSVDRVDAALTQAMDSGNRIYSAAYIMPSPRFGGVRKHSNHLALIDRLLRRGIAERISEAGSLREVYELLLSCESFGPFLAFQFTIDLNYSPVIDFQESDFVIAGPGAIDGIRKCFDDTDGLSNEDTIRVMADIASSQFTELGISFMTLWGRSLQLIDCQNLFCEVDKYSRVVHPDLRGATGRTRIKQRFAPNPEPLRVAYPPKWGLDTSRLPSPPRLSEPAA